MNVIFLFLFCADKQVLCFVFPFPGGTEVITEDDYQNGHPDLEAASSGRLGVGRDKMVYMAVKNPPKEEEDDEDDTDDDDDDDISMFLLRICTIDVFDLCLGCSYTTVTIWIHS